MPKTSAHNPSRKTLGSVAGSAYVVDRRLLLAVKSLYSCSEIYISVGGDKSQLFTVGVRLQQVSAMSPLLFIFHMN